MHECVCARDRIDFTLIQLNDLLKCDFISKNHPVASLLHVSARAWVCVCVFCHSSSLPFLWESKIKLRMKNTEEKNRTQPTRHYEQEWRQEEEGEKRTKWKKKKCLVHFVNAWQITMVFNGIWHAISNTFDYILTASTYTRKYTRSAYVYLCARWR